MTASRRTVVFAVAGAIFLASALPTCGYTFLRLASLDSTAHSVVGTPPANEPFTVAPDPAGSELGVCVEGPRGSTYDVSIAHADGSTEAIRCPVAESCSFQETCTVGRRSRTTPERVECRGPAPARCVYFVAIVEGTDILGGVLLTALLFSLGAALVFVAIFGTSRARPR